MQGDLNKIKKKYGEDMAHLCRSLFPTILENEGLLPNLLEHYFYPSKLLYEDIKSNHMEGAFQRFINSSIKYDLVKTNCNKTPFELMQEAGYTLYECKTTEDIMKFKHYYASGEELCTFRTNRIKKCHVFFAVKNNVDDITRKEKPQRQDEYGTSVISIQFSRVGNFLSIKNRYNHSVNNPDCTFSNNLDNIIPGLTASFSKYYNLDIKDNKFGFDMDNYVCVNDKFYRYNYEIDGVYYCPNNIIIDNNTVVEYPSPRYLVLDYFIIDFEKKDISQYKKFREYFYSAPIIDSFVYSICGKKEDNNKKIEKISTFKKGENHIIKINDNIIIEYNKYNNIVGYINNDITEVEDNFLMEVKNLDYLKIDNVKSIGENFLYHANIDYINLDNVKFIGNNFMPYNKTIEYISIPNVKKVGYNCLEYATALRSIKLQNAIELGAEFASSAEDLKFFYSPRLKKVGTRFLTRNYCLETLYLPALEEMGDNSLEFNRKLKALVLDSAEHIGNNCLSCCEIKSLSIPNVLIIGDSFMSFYNKLEELYAPSLEIVGDNFMLENSALKSLEAPNLRKKGVYFLANNHNEDILNYLNSSNKKVKKKKR